VTPGHSCPERIVDHEYSERVQDFGPESKVSKRLLDEMASVDVEEPLGLPDLGGVERGGDLLEHSQRARAVEEVPEVPVERFSNGREPRPRV
jgi:hypothetical protein